MTLDRDALIDTVLHQPWPQRWWLTIAGTSYTLLDTTRDTDRRWLIRALVAVLAPLRPLWTFDQALVLAPFVWGAQPRLGARPPAQWGGCTIRPASDVEVDACLRPVIA